MARDSERSKSIREYILKNVSSHAADLVAVVADQFGISRQGIHKHLNKLVREGALQAEGRTRTRRYHLPTVDCEWAYPIIGTLEEGDAWLQDVAPVLDGCPKNVIDVCQFCFTEMFNNAIDHSEGTRIQARLSRTGTTIVMSVSDNGIGIFKKIQQAFGLADEKHAILELAKGKLTTDPQRHTGQGIFFASRLVDDFVAHSGLVSYSHKADQAEDLVVEDDQATPGTFIRMQLSSHTERTCKEVFDQYSSAVDYGFIKTAIPVRLLRYGHEQLVSRSQAKRLMARVDQFRVVILDFLGIETVGQAFADEIFRVYAREHQDIEIIPNNTTIEVQQMIQRARTQWASELPGSI